MIDFDAFLNHCMLTRSLAMHHDAIVAHSYQSDRDRLEAACPIFAGDMLSSMPETIILQVCKLLDPARDFKKNENLSITFLVEHYGLDRNSLIMADLPAILARFEAFRSELEPARNKLIAHYDRAAVLSGKAMGAAPKEMWDNFGRT